jgi:hypothetical protein
MSKLSLSGLKTVTRDWSEPRSSQPSDGESIDWPSTPPKADLTPAERRLRLIQAALAEPTIPLERVLTNASSQAINKRPALSTPQQVPPAKKARQLPSTWGDVKKQVASSSLSSSTWPGGKPSSGTSIPPPVSKSSSTSTISSTSTSKVASVFLSAEQTQILKLVQDGHSVFYTGSAGELIQPDWYPCLAY